jgi:outer membrane protein
MRKTVSVLSAAVLAAAFAAPAAAELKVGVIDTVQLLRSAPQIQAAEGKIKAEFQKREDDLKAERKKIDEDIGRFRREADTMSPTQRTSAQNDLNTRATGFDIKQREFNEQFQARNNELQRDVRIKMKRAIEEVAREKGFDLMLQDAAYFAPGLDVTPLILEKLKAYGTALEPAPKADKKGDKKK